MLGSAIVLRFKAYTTFLNNTASACDGGAVYAYRNNSFTFDRVITFFDNTAHRSGGAVYVGEDNTLSFNGPKFRGDATSCAGSTSNGNSITSVGYNTFAGNTAEMMGGAISSSSNNTIVICGLTNILGNRAIFGGGIYVGHDSRSFVGGSIELSHNTAIFGGGIFVISGHVTMNAFPIGTLSNNSALGHLPGTVTTNVNVVSESGFGGAIHALDSKLNLYGSYMVTNNIATYRGGLALSSLEDSTLELHENTIIKLIGNKATSKGGAIHVEDHRFTYCLSAKEVIKPFCSFRLRTEDYWESTDRDSLGRLQFINNMATQSGSSLYGGELEECNTNYYLYDHENAQVAVQGTAVFHLLTNNDTSLDTSSDPFEVCICEDGTPKCDQCSGHYKRYPGQTLSIDVVAVGQMNGIVPSVIRAVPTGLNLTREYTTQPTVPRECTKLQYPVLPDSAGRTTALVLYSDESCSTFGIGFAANVSILPCPNGFALSDQHCICEVRLREYTEV